MTYVSFSIIATENCPLSLSLDTSVARSSLSFVSPLSDKKISALRLNIVVLMKRQKGLLQLAFLPHKQQMSADPPMP